MKNKMQKFTDKYFLRSNEILKKDNLNPWVNYQVFVRKGPGKVAGIDEAVDIITNNSNIAEVGGRIYAKKDGDLYEPAETLMNIVAPVQELMELETVYLGVIAAGTTLANGGKEPDLKAIQRNVEQVVELAGQRPVLYFGARHWHYNMDKAIAEAAFKGGVKDAATDNGAEVRGQKGVGTIPHALENVYAYGNGLEDAVLESTQAFDKYMPKEVPRIALVDYNNKEGLDTVRLMVNLPNLNAVRVDTCGENLMQFGTDGKRKYWEGKGVTVTGVVALRMAMTSAMVGYHLDKRPGIILSSGFSNPEKVKAFNEGEEFFKARLYDGIGAGFLDGVRTSTSDIIAVGESPEEVDYFARPFSSKNIIHKVGRPPRLNKTLERVL